MSDKVGDLELASQCSFSQDIVHLKLRLGKKNDTTIVHPFHGPIAGNLALSGMTGAKQTPDIELIGLISEVLYVVELAPPMHNTCGKLIYFLKKYQNHIQSSQERMPCIQHFRSENQRLAHSVQGISNMKTEKVLITQRCTSSWRYLFL